jgi:hypothetical protein
MAQQVLEFQMRDCGVVASVVLRKHRLGIRYRAFDGRSIFGRIEGEDPRQIFWDVYRLLHPNKGGEYTVYAQQENKRWRAVEGPMQFGIQDDIPEAYRKTDA